MTWTLLGIGQQDATNVELPMPPEFTDETARAWFGEDNHLRTRMWALDDAKIAAAMRMLGRPTSAEGMDYWLTCRASWVVEAYNESDDELALIFRLPSNFGFTDAARWTGTWSVDLYGGEFPLEEEQSHELGAIFGVHIDTDRYAYVLGARSVTAATSAGGTP
jgi:hypothetical protein